MMSSGKLLTLFLTILAGSAVSGVYGFRIERQVVPQRIGGAGSSRAPTSAGNRPPFVPSSPGNSNINRPSFVSNLFESLPAPLDVILTRRVSEASNYFTWDSYKALDIPPHQNVFYSPYSIMNALGMLTLGSSGRTATQLKELLRFDPTSRDLPNSYHRGLGLENQKLMNDKSAIFALGNRFFVDSGSAANINPDYLVDLVDLYNSSMEVVNFSSNPAKSRQTINNWVSKSTFGKIDNFLQSDLNPLTNLILVNTIYFNGQWVLPFDANLTAKGDFQTTSGVVSVPYMYLQGPLHYAMDQDLGVETVVLPYTNFKYALHIILPSVGTDLTKVESQLSAAYLQKLSRSTRQSPVVLKMPKFTIRQSLSLRDMLTRLNVTDVFNPLKSDFSGIFVNNRPGMLVDDVIHEAVVEVSEKGTIAAAATGIVVVRIAQTTKFVTVDRPFLFYISDESNDAILFWGRVTNPASN